MAMIKSQNEQKRLTNLSPKAPSSSRYPNGKMVDMRDQVIAKNRKSKPCPVRTPIPPFPFLLDTRLHVTGAHLHRTIQIRRPPRSGAHLSVSASVEEGARMIRLLPIPLNPPPLPPTTSALRVVSSPLFVSLSLSRRVGFDELVTTGCGGEAGIRTPRRRAVVVVRYQVDPRVPFLVMSRVWISRRRCVSDSVACR